VGKLARTVIELWFANYSDNEGTFRNLGVSINEPLDKNFPTTQPHKVWICYPAASDWNFWVETIDLNLGTYKFTVGIDAPPGKEWLIKLFVNGNEVIPQTTINSASFAQGTTTISADHPYAPWKILKTGDKYCGSEGAVIKCLKQNMETVNRILLPRVFSWDQCCIVEQEQTFMRGLWYLVWVYHYMVNPNPTEWFMPVARIQNASDPSLHTTSLPVVLTAPYINGLFWEETMDFPWRWYWPVVPCEQDTCSYALDFYGFMRSNNSSIKLTTNDSFLMQIGHIEGETPTLDEFYTDRGYQRLLQAKYVLDDFVEVPFALDETCPLPRNPLKVQIDLSTTFFMFTAPTDLRVGRRIFSYVTVKVVPEDAIGDTIPFLKVPEMPSFMNTMMIPTALGSENARQKSTQFTLIITPEMMSKGGFTLQAGHLEPDPTNTSPAAPMIPVVDDSQFIPFNIRIESVTLQKPIGIKSVTLQKPIGIIGIKSVTLRKPMSITSVKLQKRAAPPPPPGATLTGKVLGFLGPVADAEVTLNGHTTKTDKTGTFTLTDIPYGTYTLTVKPTRLLDKLLYRQTSKKLDLYASKTETITLPINLINVSLITGGTAAATAIIYKATAKPEYYY